jgi:hypothetical protein
VVIKPRLILVYRFFLAGIDRLKSGTRFGSARTRGAGAMRVLIVIFLLMSTSLVADPGKGRTREERKKARIERQLHRRQHSFDERTQDQKRRDRNVLFVMAVSTALVVKAMSGE